MAKLKAHGSILTEAETARSGRYRLMADGWILVNFGAGWKLDHKAVPGVRRGSAMAESKEAAAREVFARFVHRLRQDDALADAGL